jgi:hypothetical protein
MDGGERFVSPPTRRFEKRLSIVTRNGKEKGENKRGMRVSIEEGKEMEKKSWENRKGRENSEARIDLNRRMHGCLDK